MMTEEGERVERGRETEGEGQGFDLHGGFALRGDAGPPSPAGLSFQEP